MPILKFLILILFTCIGAAHAAPEKRVVDGISYQFLLAQPEAIRIVWKNPAGQAMRTFSEVAHHLEQQGLAVDTLMNGGIFEPGGIPSGLLIQGGRELSPVNRNAGKGNFYMQPNGIFLLGNQGAAIIHTEEYPLNGVDIRDAVQSGPTLLRMGKIHPNFKADSPSRLHRNGVGVTKHGSVYFVITEFRSPKFPNLYEFAQLFQSLGCDDALFLDGDISQMRSGQDIFNQSNPFGSIIAVLKSDNNVPTKLDNP